jgi:pilus assembly protein CpaB
MKPKTLVLMVVAIICGLGASYMTSRLLAERGSGEGEVEKVSVLVAKKHLDMATAFKNPKELLEFQEFIKGQEPKNAVTVMDQVKGKFLRRSLRKGDFLTPEDLADTYAVIPVPPGMRAIGLRVNLESIAGGFASLPGSHVDIYSTVRRPSDDDSHARVLLENVLVLAADQAKDRNEAGAMPASVITVALNTEDALRMTVAKDLGPLTLALRNPTDNTQTEVDQVTVTQVLRRKSDKVHEEKSGAAFVDEAPVGGGGALKVPVVANAKRSAKKVEMVEKVEAPAPLKAAPEVRKYVVTVQEGAHTRKVMYVLNANGEVSQEDVAEAGTGDTTTGLAPTTPPAGAPRPIAPPVTSVPPVVAPRGPVVRPGGWGLGIR